MRTVESVDEDIDCLALGGMNNGVLGLRKSTASMSSAMSVSSDQMSTGKGMDETDTFSYPLTPPLTLPSHVPTGGDLGNESTVEESDGAMSEGGGGSTTPESSGHHGAHQLISSSAHRTAMGPGLTKTTVAKHELEQHEDSDEVG